MAGKQGSIHIGPTLDRYKTKKDTDRENYNNGCEGCDSHKDNGDDLIKERGVSRHPV